MPLDSSNVRLNTLKTTDNSSVIQHKFDVCRYQLLQRLQVLETSNGYLDDLVTDLVMTAIDEFLTLYDYVQRAVQLDAITMAVFMLKCATVTSYQKVLTETADSENAYVQFASLQGLSMLWSHNVPVLLQTSFERLKRYKHKEMYAINVRSNSA